MSSWRRWPSGRPVVATRAQGVEEALGELAKDQCVHVGNGEQLGEKIIHLAQNPALATEIGRRNQRRASELFSIDAMVASYERLYSSILSA